MIVGGEAPVQALGWMGEKKEKVAKKDGWVGAYKEELNAWIKTRKELVAQHKQEKMVGWLELEHIQKWLWVNASTKAHTLWWKFEEMIPMTEEHTVATKEKWLMIKAKKEMNKRKEQEY